MNEQQQWYVTIAGNAVGPVSTDLVLRGIKHKKIAREAYVCVVGASEWLALTDVPEFHGALQENGLLPVTRGEDETGSSASEPAHASQLAQPLMGVEENGEFETTAQFASRGPSSDSPSRVPGESTSINHSGTSEPVTIGTQESTLEAERAALGAEVPLLSGPRNGKHPAPLDAQSPAVEIDIDVHVTVDDVEAPAIDWNHGFADYFLVDAEVTLPNEQLLIHSLAGTPHDTFLHDEPMWNLALCLAFGTNTVASVAADVFFDVVTAHAQYDRIEWMARTLLSRGFMPSGIPHSAGNQGIGWLRQACPDELRVQLESQLGI